MSGHPGTRTGAFWDVAAGNRYCTDDAMIGRIRLPEHCRTIAWGDDGHALSITAGSGLYRIRLRARGRPAS